MLEIGSEQNSTIVFPLPIDLIGPLIQAVGDPGRRRAIARGCDGSPYNQRFASRRNTGVTTAVRSAASIPTCCARSPRPRCIRGIPGLRCTRHASWVFVAGDCAYKVKKPVSLCFLDYSTLARRHSACREEVRVNRELAPGLYLGVRAIVRSRAGFYLARDGATRAVEYAVEMQSFSEQETFAGLIATGSLPSACCCGGAPARGLSPLRSRGD